MLSISSRTFFDRLSSLIIASLIGLLFILLGILPWFNAQQHWGGPELLLIIVAWWRASRREDMPLFLVFLLGILQDLIGHGRLGETTLPLLLIAAFPTHLVNPSGGTARLLRWIIFSVLAAFYLAIQYGILSITLRLEDQNFTSPSSLRFIQCWLSSILAYIFLSAIFRRCLGVIWFRERR